MIQSFEFPCLAQASMQYRTEYDGPCGLAPSKRKKSTPMRSISAREAYSQPGVLVKLEFGSPYAYDLALPASLRCKAPSATATAAATAAAAAAAAPSAPSSLSESASATSDLSMALSDPEPVATPTALACEPQRQLPPLAALSSQPESLDAAESLLALPRADETPTDLHGADGLAELLAVASKSSPCDAPAQAERTSLPGDIASPCDSYSDGSSSSLPAGSADARALTCPMALLRAPGTNAAAAAADPLVSTTCYYQYIGISRWNLPRRYRSSDEESVPASIYYAQLGDRRNLSDDLASLANGNSIRLRSSASLSPRKTPYSRPVGISVGSNGSVGSSSGGASAGAGGSPSRSTTARSASPSSTGSSRSPSSSQAGSIAATKSVRSSRSKIRGQR